MMTKGHTLVVGGTRGTGRVIVRKLAAEGHTLSVIGLRPPSEENPRIVGVDYWALDLQDEEGLKAACPEIINHNGKIANLIFCQRYRGQDDDWRGEIETSLTGTKQIIEGLISEFDENYQNSIVVIASLASNLVAEEQPLSYHVVKAALNQLVRYYAVTLGPKGIRVNSVSPGAVLKESAKQYYDQNNRLHRYICSITPLGRMASSDDVANAASFLCSPNASYITGQNIVVDGGLSLTWQESLARKFSEYS